MTGRPGNRDLWVVPSAGGEPRRLVRDASFDVHPAWSPDGKSIAYAAFDLPPSFSLRIVPAAGGEPRTLLSEPAMLLRPVWSSDGRTLLFSRTSNGTTNIWKLALDDDLASTGALERVTLGEGTDLFLSGPDASGRLAFATIKHRSDIWELAVETGALRQVTHETVVEDYASVSPDGTLAVVSMRDGAPAVWTADLEGRLLTRIGAGGFPQWSPDGRLLAYTRLDTMEVVVQRPGEVAPRVVAPGNFAAWTPDGRRLLVEKGEGESLVIVAVDLESGGKRVILRAPNTTGFGTDVAPDGTIVFQGNDENEVRQVWVLPAGGAAPRQVTRGASESSHPRLRPGDPETVVYLENHKHIVLLSLETGETTRLREFTDSNLVIDYPTWSPDGTKIYFTMAKNVGDVFLLENY